MDREEIKKQIEEVVEEARETVDDVLYSPEAAAIGAGMAAAAIVGYMLRHPEMMMFMAAEAGDVATELASEVGGLSSAVEIGGD